MAKSKTFKWNGDGSAVVYVPGHSSITFAEGERRTVETDDAAVIAALQANPDVDEVKGSKK